jgi:hypothetical protein
MIDLHGRLERVHLHSPYRGNTLIGDYLDHIEQIFVSNGKGYEEKNVLVKTDLRYEGTTPTGNLISQNIPAGFTGLAPEEFVLSGLIEQDMDLDDNSTLTDVNIYFDPGHIGRLVMIDSVSDEGYTGFLLSRRSSEYTENLYDELLNQLPNPAKNTRTMLFSNEGTETKFQVYLQGHDIELIRMDRLPPKSINSGKYKWPP